VFVVGRCSCYHCWRLRCWYGCGRRNEAV